MRSGTPILLALACAAAIPAGAGVPQAGALTLDPTAAAKHKLPYFPIRIALQAQKPAEVKKEPIYIATPRYGSIRVGNAPNHRIVIAVDEPEQGDWKIYVDSNANGDLTDDGNGNWTGKRDAGGRTMYGVSHFVVQGAWKGADGKPVTAGYGFAMYRFTNQDYVLMYREAGRTGTVRVDGKDVSALLVENDGDGIFSKPVETVQQARAGRPVWLLLDLNGDGKFDVRGGEQFDIRAPFKLNEKTFEAVPAPDGSTLKLTPTTKVALDLSPRQQERPPLLAAGVPAPDFTAEKWGGGETRLSQYRGKIVLLDFWATWCGPCRVSMPHLEQVYRKVKNQNVVVLALCVWDEKPAYEKWVPENRARYSFDFAFDTAGRADTNIAQKLYQVSGIPTTYVIDKEGKVVTGIVGFQGEQDHRIEDALKGLGVKVD